MRVRKSPNPVQNERLRRLWTQEQFADRVGVNVSTVRKAERGIPLLLLTQERIARALGMKREELFPEPLEESVSEEAAV